MESFPSLGKLVFDIIPKNLFLETLDFSHDWTVRYLNLEEVCLIVRGYNKPLDNAQQWGLTKYLYVLFCGGEKIEFLGSKEMQSLQKKSEKK